ncbi:hypothetical protein AMATHDRAFT_190438 [Amanita thiersii Skay4041]|uniref:DUF6535 domain-containing protein n=1 Tax=Amanita thiersii Skay4041 TaxID=703135 RepID=A0A2A9NUW6_9AGAR|nr:hypothetical protein AMATHDRAFT_190438 [Amanita thiersii Skay4041]
MSTPAVIDIPHPPSPPPNPHQPWRSGTHIHHPPPSLGRPADSWKHCNNVFQEQVHDICTKWKDEIDKLLIFAGLFSSVVAGFSVQSYTWLQKNPSDITNRLLASIVIQLNSSSIVPDVVMINDLLVPKKTDSWAVQVNIFWFLSLSLSLSAAIIGILCLQWLREHERKVNLSAKEAFALQFMRYEGLVQWHVPAIIASLPLLLQTSLVFFFVGLLELLWNLNHTVAVVITIVSGLTLLFLAATTVLPAVQFLSHQSRRLRISQCPFKSPQSLAIHRIFSKIILGLLHLVLVLPSRLGITKNSNQEEKNDDIQQVLWSGRLSWRGLLQRTRAISEKSDWSQVDIYWQRRRSMRLHNDSSPTSRNDHINGLDRLSEVLPEEDESYVHIYTCLQDSGIQKTELPQLAPVIHQMASRSDPGLINGTLSADMIFDCEVEDILTALVLRYQPLTDDPKHASSVINHCLELSIRILNSAGDRRTMAFLSVPLLVDKTADHFLGKTVLLFLYCKFEHLIYPVPEDIIYQCILCCQRLITNDHHVNDNLDLFFNTFNAVLSQDPIIVISKPYIPKLFELCVSIRRWMDKQKDDGEYGAIALMSTVLKKVEYHSNWPFQLSFLDFWHISNWLPQPEEEEEKLVMSWFEDMFEMNRRKMSWKLRVEHGT